jgi:hypothetical protein
MVAPRILVIFRFVVTVGGQAKVCRLVKSALTFVDVIFPGELQHQNVAVQSPRFELLLLTQLRALLQT